MKFKNSDGHKIFDIIINAKKEQRNLNNEELTILNNFDGWGGIDFDKESKQLLDQKINEYLDAHEIYSSKERIDFLIEQKYRILDSYYTPKFLVDKIVEKILTNIKSNQNQIKILEPSAGNGVFIDSFLKKAKEKNINVKITAVEKDHIIGNFLELKYSNNDNVNVIVDGFENLDISENNMFDIICSNIPFGNHKIDGKSIHNYFFEKSYQHIKENGLTAFITSTYFLDALNNQTRENIFRDFYSLEGVIRFPQNLYKNTSIESDLLILRNNNENIIDIEDINSIKNVNNIHINKYIYEKKLYIGNIYESVKYGKNTYSIKCEKNTIESKINDYFDNHLSLTNIEYLTIQEKKDTNLAVVENTKIFHDKLFEYYEFINLNDEENINFLNINVFEKMHKDYKKDVKNVVNTLLKYHQVENYSERQEKLNKLKEDLQFFLDKKEYIKYYQEYVLELENKNNFSYKNYSKQLNDFVSSLIESRINYNNLDNDYEQQKLMDNFEKINQNNIFYEFFSPCLPTAKNREIKSYFNNLYNKIITTKKHINSVEARDELKTLYNKKIEFGFKNLKKAEFFIDGFLEDEVRKEILSLEYLENGTYVSSDILESSSIRNYENLSISNAIYMSYIKNNNNVSIEDVVAMSGKTKDEVLEYITENKLLFRNPKNQKYEPRDIYLSGDIREKISICEKNEGFQDNIEELKNVCLPYMLPNIELGESWVDEKLYISFFKDRYGVEFDNLYFSYKVQNWVVNPYYADVDFLEKCKFNRVNIKDIIRISLTGESPIINRQEKIFNKGQEKTITVVDFVETQRAVELVNNIRNDFKDYVKIKRSDIEFKDLFKNIDDVYNKTFNSIIPLKLNTDNLNFKTDSLFPTDYQKTAVMKCLLQGKGLLNHEVGFGKTLSMAMIAHEMKNSGVANKVLILALKANISSIQKEINQVYPNSKILYSNDKELNKLTRKSTQEFLKKMKNNDYDFILMTHDQFQFIPQNDELYSDLIKQELDVLEEEMIILSKNKTNKRMEKGLFRRQQSLTKKLQEAKERMDINNKRKDKLLNFRDIGIDTLIVDEAHQFKNLGYMSRHDGVKGMGTSNTSQKAFNLLLAIMEIFKLRKEEKGVFFATGTPISNSISELYNIFKFLSPSRLEKICNGSYDVFLRNYCHIKEGIDVDATGGYKKNIRLVGINEDKMESIRNDFLSFTDIVKRDLGFETYKQLPKKIIVNETVEMNEIQKELNKVLIAFTSREKGKNTIDAEKIFCGSPLDYNQSMAKALLSINIAKKISTDTQMLFGYVEELTPKLQKLIDNVYEIYSNENEKKGTQLIFLDTGIPKTKDFINDISTYSKIKRGLVKKGISEKEILFVQDFTSSSNSKEIFEKKLNSGEARIAIGGTQNMGTGINVQERCCAIHNVDVPYRPSDIEQRNGRGVRQGNIYENVLVYNYGTKLSLDAMLYDIVNKKDKMIKDFEFGKKLSENNVDDELSNDEIIAELSGDKKLLIHQKELNNLKKNQYILKGISNDLNVSSASLEWKKEALKNNEKKLNIMEKEIEELNKIKTEEEWKKPCDIEVKKIRDIDAKKIKSNNIEIVKHINKIREDNKKNVSSINYPVKIIDKIKGSQFSLYDNGKFLSINSNLSGEEIYKLDLSDEASYMLGFLNSRLFTNIYKSVSNIKNNINKLNEEILIINNNINKNNDKIIEIKNTICNSQKELKKIEEEMQKDNKNCDRSFDRNKIVEILEQQKYWFEERKKLKEENSKKEFQLKPLEIRMNIIPTTPTPKKNEKTKITQLKIF